MQRPRSRRWLVVGAVAVAVVAIVVVLFSLGYLAPHTTSPSASAALPSTFLNLTIVYNATSGIANYSAPFLSVEANTHLFVTITNHDPTPSPLMVPWDNRVVGTVGGNMSMNCGQGVSSVTGLPPNGISHTWTVLDAFYNISVPIPPAPSLGTPCVVGFELILDHSEMTTWGCVANCDNGAMQAGRMWGVLLITG